MIYGPRRRHLLSSSGQPQARRGDLNPQNRDGRGQAFPRANALWIVRAGCRSWRDLIARTGGRIMRAAETARRRTTHARGRDGGVRQELAAGIMPSARGRRNVPLHNQTSVFASTRPFENKSAGLEVRVGT